MSISFAYHCLRRDISNFSMLKHRHYDGFLISMHQSGTHWLKHMLATALTSKYQLPAPADLAANSIIGGTKDPRIYPQLPHLVSTHSIPHILIQQGWCKKLLQLPPYIILVRDARASLVSNYEKWKQHYDCSFTEYLRGDIAGRRFNNDIWWCIRFYNAWGRMAARHPERTLVLNYEDLREQTLAGLQKVDQFWGLNLGEEGLQKAILQSTKEKMANKSDAGQVDGLTIVRQDERDFSEWFTETDRVFFAQTMQRYCKYNFAYDFAAWRSE